MELVDEVRSNKKSKQQQQKIERGMLDEIVNGMVTKGLQYRDFFLFHSVNECRFGSFPL